MREIQFKGKRIDNGKWVEGFNFNVAGKSMILNFTMKQYGLYHNMYEVDPETVCQYTGLTDKNGKKIFEGDIVKAGEILVVSWKEKLASWCLCKKGWMYNHFFGEAVNAEDCEVIGNIFDNPDLLTA